MAHCLALDLCNRLNLQVSLCCQHRQVLDQQELLRKYSVMHLINCFQSKSQESHMYHQKEQTVMVRLLEIHNYLMLHLIQHYSVILPKELSQDLLWMAVGSHTHLKKEVRLEAEPRVIHNY